MRSHFRAQNKVQKRKAAYLKQKVKASVELPKMDGPLALGPRVSYAHSPAARGSGSGLEHMIFSMWLLCRLVLSGRLQRSVWKCLVPFRDSSVEVFLTTLYFFASWAPLVSEISATPELGLELEN